MVLLMELNGVAFPVAGELSQAVCQQLAGGQPLVLCSEGRPVAILIDLESWAEVEAALGPDAADE